MLKRRNHLLAGVLVLTVPLTLAAASAAAASARTHATHGPGPVLRVMRPAPAGVKAPHAGVIPAREPSAAAYAAQKAAANAAAAGRVASSPALSAAALAPSALRNWAGLRDTTVAPSDSTGAIGTTRYIELVNSKVAIYSRTSNTPTASGPLLQLTGCATAGCTSDSVFDVQVIWDPGTNRFFYTTMDTTTDGSGNFLTFGYSTTATPTLSASSWCRFGLGFGSTLPDYPKLGDTSNFILMGFNAFNGSSLSFIGSHIAWVKKPPAGSSCPTTFPTFGVTGTLKNADGSVAFTPVPANQTDTSSTGWAVAMPASFPSTGATFLTLYKVTRSSTGSAVIPTTGTSVSVNAYKVPANAPQPGTAFRLDTLDGRPTQAVSAVDPVRGGVTALWTQHTVFGGAGAQVRWYEINPATHAVIQRGTISSSSLYTFNAAISPDRRVNGTSRTYGGDMVINVNQSSSSVLPTVKVASKVGTNAISALKTIATSAAPDTGFDCIRSGTVCRWGDYAGASPDPAAPTSATVGQVWGTSMLSASGGSSSSSGWTTRNFAIKP